MKIVQIFKDIVPSSWKRKFYEYIASFSINHQHGKRTIQLSNSEAAVTCLVKNGEFYIESFIVHYQRMGFRHIFFLDNGSTDQTIPIAKKHKDVTIYTTTLPVGKFQAVLKKIMAIKMVSGGWCLDVDIDEYFDYPHSNIINLNKFLNYLNNHNYNSVLTQMLDMFSDKPLSYLKNKQNEDIKSVYRFYDLTQIKKINYYKDPIAMKYGKDNEITNSNIHLFYGGIRKSLYGIDCLLSKHSLFSRQEKIELFTHVHFLNSSKVADISCVLLHFKLTSNAYETSLQNKKSFSGTSYGYSDFIELLINQPYCRIKQNTSIEFQNVNQLITDNFLKISDNYKSYIKNFTESNIQKKIDFNVKNSQE